VLVHQNAIKLADFGLSKRIEEASNKTKENFFGMIPYIDPKKFNRQENSDNPEQVYILSKKSDVYSVGILLWEISSGKPPFYIQDERYDIYLATEILQGLNGTPNEYVKIYTGNIT
jgi:serine/threonine protein kinase